MTTSKAILKTATIIELNCLEVFDSHNTIFAGVFVRLSVGFGLFGFFFLTFALHSLRLVVQQSLQNEETIPLEVDV